VLVEDSPDWRSEDPTVEVDDRLSDLILRSRLRVAYETLPEPCRQLLRILMADPPPSYADVSEALSMPIGSIGPTRARCLRRLRDLVDREGQVELASTRTSRSGG
jgi:DNA-directed RNA polymerase specialized sigma24 family protein